MRRQPLYVLHDASESAEASVGSLLHCLRSDPWCLEAVWLGVISLGVRARLLTPLAEVCEIQSSSFPLEEGVNLNEGLALFCEDYARVRRPTTATVKGDWRPVLAVVLTSPPTGEFANGLAALSGVNCRIKLAFIGEHIPQDVRDQLENFGFKVFQLSAEGAVFPGGPTSLDHTEFWWCVLLRQINEGFHFAVPPLASKPHPGDTNVAPLIERTTSEPTTPELKPDNLFTTDLTKLTTDGRLNRRGLLMYLLIYFGLIFISVFIGYLSTTLSSVVGIVAWAFLILGLIKRSHDVGRSGWFILIPFFSLWLFVVPGQVGPNYFGPEPDSSR